MKTISLSIVLLLICRMTISACTTAFQEVFPAIENIWGNFTGIELKNSVNIIVKQGKKNDVRIEYDKNNSIPYVTVVTEKDRLVIDGTQRELNSGKEATVYITLKDLRLVISNGTGDITFDESLSSDKLEIRINSSGNVTAQLDTKFLKVIVAGSGNLEVNGNTDASDIKINGSGNVLGKDLKTSTSNIVITGSGSSTVDVIDELTINITGSGNVYFLSYPERMNARSKNIGQVEKIKA